MSRVSSLFFQGLNLAILLLASLCSNAVAAPGACQVSLKLFRSGLPASDVPFTICQFDYKTGKAKPPRFLKANRQGEIKVEVILPPPRLFFGTPLDARNRCPDYLLIDAKDAPLALVDLEMFRYPSADMLRRIELTAGSSTVMGKVVQGTNSETAAPVVGANVTMTSVGNFLLNDRQRGVSTPQVTGKTIEGGIIKLRPLNCYLSSGNGTSCRLVATYKAKGQLLKSHITGLILREPAKVVPSFRPRYYLMAPPIGMGGQVVETGSNRPIEGAIVELRGRWLAEPMFAFTDRLGRWRIDGIPPQWDKQFFAIATHPKYGLSWQPVQIPNTGDKGWIVDGTPLTETTLHMAGMTVLKGRIIDDTNGKAPQFVHPDWPIRPLLFSAYSSGDAKTRLDNNLPFGYTETEIQSDGSFLLPVPIGDNFLHPVIPFFYGIDNQKLSIDVKEQGLSDVVIRVKKSVLGMVVQFVAENPKDLRDIQVLDITTDLEGVPRGGDATTPYYMWGTNVAKAENELKVRIKYGAGKTFETKFVHSPENWPQIVVLPANPPTLH
jgi:hypothetical protein